jgi:hypothetical protein
MVVTVTVVARTPGDRRRTREPGVIPQVILVIVVGMGEDRSARRRRGRTQVCTVVVVTIAEDDGFARRIYDDVVGHPRNTIVVVRRVMSVAKGSCQEKLSPLVRRRCWFRC